MKQSVTVLLIKGIIWKFWRVSCLSAGNQELFTTHSIRVFRHRLSGDSQNAMIASPIEHVCLIKQETVAVQIQFHVANILHLSHLLNFIIISWCRWSGCKCLRSPITMKLKTQTKTIWVAIYICIKVYIFFRCAGRVCISSQIGSAMLRATIYCTVCSMLTLQPLFRSTQFN